MIKTMRYTKIGKIPAYNGADYGKIQISSKQLAKYVGRQMHICLIIYEPSDVIELDGVEHEWELVIDDARKQA